MTCNGLYERDGRKLDHETVETIRLMAIERLREGVLASAVMELFGGCRTTIYKWRGEVAHGYAPEPNHNELVRNYVKRTGTARRPLGQDESLQDNIEALMLAVQRNPRLVRSFFRAPYVAYIAD